MTYEFWPFVAGLVAACLSILAYLPYMHGMLRGTIRPLRATWLIWAVLSALSASANWAEGATVSMAFVGLQAGFTSLIFLFSLKYGMGSLVRPPDLWIVAIAGCGIALWWVTSSALWALGLSLSVSALGGVATLLKTYKAPATESVTCWAIALGAAGFGALSVGKLDAALLAYPAYLCVLYAGILTAIWLGRRRSKNHSQGRTEGRGDDVVCVPLLLNPKQRIDRPNLKRAA